MLTDEERAFLREVAWDGIRARLMERSPGKDLPVRGRLAEPGSAFVTLRNRGDLRGCIGFIGDRLPLARCVREAAIGSIADPRFPPVTPREMRDLVLEISVLSAFRRVASPEEVEVGTHGLFLRRGFSSGILLPRVATEQHYGREQFLDAVCRKSGVPEGAWKLPDTELSMFETEVF
ncbi:MAG: AmmeMemoRadiSam system protein A [Planctomycetes bacterium]|nr:AmmeMemoRadiSam system protein A [Planctomycetota bacterium]